MDKPIYSDDRPIARVLEDYLTTDILPRSEEDRLRLKFEKPKRRPRGNSDAIRCECGRYTLRTALAKRHRCRSEHLQRAIMRNLGDTVRAWRTMKARSAEYVENLAGLRQGTIQALEDRENPIDAYAMSVGQIQRIFSVLGCDLEIRPVDRPTALEIAKERAELMRPKRLDDFLAKWGPETE